MITSDSEKLQGNAGTLMYALAMFDVDGDTESPSAFVDVLQRSKSLLDSEIRCLIHRQFAPEHCDKSMRFGKKRVAVPRFSVEAGSLEHVPCPLGPAEVFEDRENEFERESGKPDTIAAVRLGLDNTLPYLRKKQYSFLFQSKLQYWMVQWL